MTLTVNRLKSLLFYNAETGDFTWLVSRGPRRAGSIAGSVGDATKITVDGKAYRAARLAIFYTTGEWGSPPAVMPSVWSRRSKSGYRGVSMHPAGRWQAVISVGGKNKHLGYFATALAASEAYQAARQGDVA